MEVQTNSHDILSASSITADFQEPNDWTYSMRREMQEIVKGLFLGPYSVAVRSKENYLETHGITHIVCVRQDIESHMIKTHFVDKFQYLVVNVKDSVTENIIQHFQKVKNFLDSCFSAGGKALVHGNAGISRSAAIVLGFLMQKYCLDYREAFSLVQQRRFCINPNEGFVQQLKEYEPIYKANWSVTNNGQCSREQSTWKRKRDSIENDDAMDE
ncbi:serine/threonine/tyrosine-interacting protein B-like [Daphnia pulicaria]|uniref:serine/threonine/tyrosine-interacting protein B-like n=1 Tax=Daphnia pulicaria TaxID=35523 RepID=UPI001EEB91EB|nr:serine/threonine/tyrosine-interacting protein B-like [Daphnia pulicaria]